MNLLILLTGAVAGGALAWVLRSPRRARTASGPVPAAPEAGPAPSSALPGNVFIPGRNFPEMVERLGSEENLFGAVLESMREGVLILNQADRIVLMNPSAGRILGMGADEALGRQYLEVVSHPGLVELLARAKSEERAVEGEIEVPGAEERVFAVSADALRSREGLTLGLLVVLADITHVKKLVRMRADFVANVTHELKTPLTAILGYVETLKDGAIEDAKNRKGFLGRIDDQARRLNELITDALELSRIESGKYIEALGPVDVGKACQTALELLRSKAEARKIVVQGPACQGAVPLLATAHEEGLLRVLVNLLDNAFKYSPEGGEVSVSAATSEGRVTISVTDQGPGIPAGSRERIFERFYRVDSSRSRQAGGTGLGLAIVKHLVERMKGSVILESREGKGSTFTVIFPSA